MKTLNLTLSIVAGLMGGSLVQFLLPSSVHAQAKSTAPKTLEAQAFRLVNEVGAVAGTFSVDWTAPQK